MVGVLGSTMGEVSGRWFIDEEEPDTGDLAHAGEDASQTSRTKRGYYLRAMD